MVRLLAGIAIGVAATTVALNSSKTKSMLNAGKKELKKGFEGSVESLKKTKENLKKKIHNATAPLEADKSLDKGKKK